MGSTICLKPRCAIGPNLEISLEKLTLKLVKLLALVTAQRMQTLASIDIRNIEKSTAFENKLKASKINKVQLVLNIPFYAENTCICAASALETYLDKTTDLRGNETRLFVALKKIAQRGIDPDLE